ncbi:hypothetical protein Pan1_80 [Pseudanabaena phage Pan1]|nr:hypothetical protein Pan1_80 [Pseudanabaena phage Pan1]
MTEERFPKVNASAREEGWGLITDQALKILPEDVESQARAVARWAYDEIKRFTDRHNTQANELVALEKQAAASSAALARIVPRYQGTRQALLHLRAELRRSEAARAQADWNAAAARLKVAQAEVVLAEAAARRGDHDIPSSIEARVLQEWLDETRETSRNEEDDG